MGNRGCAAGPGYAPEAFPLLWPDDQWDPGAADSGGESAGVWRYRKNGPPPAKGDFGGIWNGRRGEGIHGGLAGSLWASAEHLRGSGFPKGAGEDRTGQDGGGREYSKTDGSCSSIVRNRVWIMKKGLQVFMHVTRGHRSVRSFKNTYSVSEDNSLWYR